MTTKIILSENRKDIPPYQIVGKYDYSRLINEIKTLNLLDRSIWSKINFGEDENNLFEQVATKHSDYYSRWFGFAEHTYKDLFLNEIDYELLNSTSDEDFQSQKSRARVITDQKKLRNQRNAEFIFKPKLKSLFNGTYLEEIYKDIGSKFLGGSGRIKIGWMAGNTEVKEHIDADSALILKVHIPLVTNNNVKFFVRFKGETQEHYMPADGTATLLNVGIPHRVVNESNQDRYHLIVNVYSSIV
jgi:hypothetical protein